MVNPSLTDKHFQDLLSLKRAVKNYIRRMGTSTFKNADLIIGKDHAVRNAVCDLEGNYDYGFLPSEARLVWKSMQDNSGLNTKKDMEVYCNVLLGWIERELDG